MLQLREIEYALSIVKYGSVHKAADALFVSQPAITKSIKKLESDLGVTLFERNNNRLVLTDAGKLLMERGLRLIEMADELETDLKKLGSANRSTITIGLTPYYSRYFFPKLYTQLRETHPNYTLKLRTDNGLDLFNMLKTGDIDIWFTASDKTDDEIETVNISRENIVLIYKKTKLVNLTMLSNISRNHGVASVSLDEIKTIPLIMYEKAHGLHSRLMDIFERYGIKPNIVFEAASAELIAECVLNGIGVGFVPLKLVEALIESGGDIGYIDFGIESPLSLKYNTMKNMTAVKKAFIEEAVACLKGPV